MNPKLLLELLENIEYKKLLDNSFYKKNILTNTYKENPLNRMNSYIDKVIENNPLNDFQWMKEIQDPERRIHLMDHIYDLFDSGERNMTRGIKDYKPQLKRPLNEIITEVNDRDFRLGNVEDIVNNNHDEMIENFIANNKGNIQTQQLSDDDLVRAIMDSELNNWSRIR